MYRFTTLSLTLFLILVGAATGPLPLAAQDDWNAGLFTAARQLPLVSQALVIRVAGGEATVELIQVFANEAEEVAQADYRLHLPRGAIVSDFGFWRDGRFLAAELKEKQAARQAHGDAAAEGRATALMQREGTMHSFSVYPIAGGGLQQVETSIRLPVATERGRSHLRLPVDAFLGHASVTSTAIVHLETDEPLRSFGVDGAPLETLKRAERRAKLAFSCDRPVEIWWAEEAPPLLTRAEMVTLDDGGFGVQVRLVLNDAGEWNTPYRQLVLLVDTSFSMRRRARALIDLVERILDQAPVPVRIRSVAGTDVDLETDDRRELLTDLLSGGAGFRTEWDDLVAAAAVARCSDPTVRCVTITDPQVDGLTAERSAELETLFLADADELSYFGSALGADARVYQGDIEPRARLYALADELVLPVLEVVDAEQRGVTFELHGAAHPRGAEGGLLRLFATSRSTEPVELRLAIAGREIERVVEIEHLEPESRQGRAVRRGLYSRLLAAWVGDYRRSRDPDLRQQVIDVSLREGIPTELTALHVAEPALAAPAAGGALPRTATPAALARILGWLLTLLGAAALWLSRRWDARSRRPRRKEAE